MDQTGVLAGNTQLQKPTPSFSDYFCQQADQAMKKLQSSLSCQGSWGNHREMYRNGWNQYRKLGHLQTGKTKTLLEKPKSVSISMSGWVLFVNSRNQRKSLATEVTHSRVKVNYKQVLKRWGYWRVEKNIIHVISSLGCHQVGTLVPGAARWVENSTIWATQTWIRHKDRASCIPCCGCAAVETDLYILPTLSSTMSGTQTFDKRMLNEWSPVHCKVWFTWSAKKHMTLLWRNPNCG